MLSQLTSSIVPRGRRRQPSDPRTGCQCPSGTIIRIAGTGRRSRRGDGPGVATIGASGRMILSHCVSKPCIDCHHRGALCHTEQTSPLAGSRPHGRRRRGKKGILLFRTRAVSRWKGEGVGKVECPPFPPWRRRAWASRDSSSCCSSRCSGLRSFPRGGCKREMS